MVSILALKYSNGLLQTDVDKTELALANLDNHIERRETPIDLLLGSFSPILACIV